MPPPRMRADNLLVRGVTAGESDVLLYWLQSQPVPHLFLLGWYEQFGVLPHQPQQLFEFVGAFDAAAQLVGVGLLVNGSICCTSELPRPAALQIGKYLRQRGAILRTVLGPEEVTEAVWEGCHGRQNRSVRAYPQVLLSLRSRDLRYWGEPALLPATAQELPMLLDASLQMYVEELGMTPNPEELEGLRASTTAKVQAGRTWCIQEPLRGELVFKASISAWSTHGAQIEGVWTAPAWRGRGIARRALSELCRQLLLSTPLVTLYTARSNEAALRLYRRVGFRAARSWLTLQRLSA